jgi:hypothetical protein
MNKKILAIFVLLALLLIGVLIFISVKKGSDNQDLTTVPNAVEIITKESNTVIGLAPDQSSTDNEGLVYFDLKNKQFVRIENGTGVPLYQVKYEPLYMSYSPDRSKVLLTGDVNDVFRPIDFIDLDNKSKLTLSPNIINAVFVPDGKGVLFHYVDHDKQQSTVYVSDFTFKGGRKVLDLSYSEDATYILRFSGASTFWVMRATSDLGLENLRQYDLDGKAIQTTREDYFEDFLPSPEGQSLAAVIAGDHYSKDMDQTAKEDGRSSTLSLFRNSLGWNNYDLRSASNQMVWAHTGKFLYVIGKGPNETNNALYRINTVDGKLVRLDTAIDHNFDIYELSISTDNKTLYVVSNGQLHTYLLESK